MKRPHYLWTNWLSILAAILPLAVVTAGCGGSSSGPLAISLNPSTTQSVDENQSIAFTAFIVNDSSDAGVSWSLSGPKCSGPKCGTLSNVTKNSVTFTAQKSIQQTVTITAIANANKSVTTKVNIVISLAPVIITTSLPGAINGENYSEQIQANGGVAPLIFTVSSGSLPPGLHLNTNGLVTGRPSVTSGTFNFTVQVTDQGTPPLTASQAFSINIAPAPPLSIVTTSLANGSQGTVYNAALNVTGGVPPLTWSISAGSLPPGISLDSTTGQLSGTPTTQGTFNFTVQVVDSALLPPNGTSQTATQPLSITVGLPQPLTITTTVLPAASTATLYSATLGASGGIGPYTWKLTGGLLTSGLSLDTSKGVISGTPTAVSSNSFSVQVTDSEMPPAQAAATFTLATSASTNNDPLLEGVYSFVFSGFNSGNPIVLGGTLNFNGGGSLVGLEDINNSVGTTQNNNVAGPSANNAVTGTYSVGSDGRGSFILTVANLTSTYQFALDGNGDAQFIEADSTGTHGTGILRKQTTTNFTPASVSSNYVFEFVGVDSSGKRDALAGFFHADGISQLENLNLDTNDNGSLGTNLSSSGTFVLGENGRGSASLAVPNQGKLSFVFYVVSPSDILFLGFDQLGASNPMTIGEAVLQTQPSFNTAGLSGSGVVATTGLGSSGNSSVFAGLITGNGSGSMSASFDKNDGGSITQNAMASGSYTIAPNGRVSLNGLGSNLGVIYLTGTNQGFVIGQDSEVSAGTLEAQSGAPFSSASFTSYFSLGEPSLGSPANADKNAASFVGSILSDGSANVTGKLNEQASGLANSNLALKATYAVAANGRGVLSVSSPQQLPSQFVFYMVSSTAVRAISAIGTDTHPQILFLNH